MAWTKLDPDTVIDILRGGADDIGGLLIDGVLMPAAGQSRAACRRRSRSPTSPPRWAAVRCNAPRLRRTTRSTADADPQVHGR